MQNPETLQLVKEQLKITNQKLKNQTRIIEKTEKKIKDVVKLNQKKMAELQVLIKGKEEEIKEAQQAAWAARAARHAKMGKSGKEGDGEDLDYSTDPQLLKKLQELKKNEAALKAEIEKNEKIRSKQNREKKVLLKELKKLKKLGEETDVLKDRNKELRQELDNLRRNPGQSLVDYEELIREKDNVIESYEKMLYGDAAPGQEGMLPSEIILELREDLDILEEERRKMELEMEKLAQSNTELEMKLSMADEKDSAGRLDSRMNVEGRGAQTAEFSSGLENFLITYSDMITLLLVIFVLLYTVSKLNVDKFAEALSSFQSKKVRIEVSNVWLTGQEVAMLDRVRELVKDNVDPESLVRSDTRTILIRLQNSDLFGPGSADLLEGADQIILDAIRGQMQEGVKQALVEGHTDNVPIKNDQFPSNWELSSARASSVARVIIEKLNFRPEQLVVSGYGEYRPLKPNDSDDNRALNRRVDIKILKDKEVAKEEESAGQLGKQLSKDKAPPAGQAPSGEAPTKK